MRSDSSACLDIALQCAAAVRDRRVLDVIQEARQEAGQKSINRDWSSPKNDYPI